MTGTPLFVDISGAQGVIDWPVYRQWAASFDGVARVAMKATEGVGFTDPRFHANRAGALSAGVDEIYYYHFGRPDLGNFPANEANYMRTVVGDIRSNDKIVLDYEVDNPQATAIWALAWLQSQEANYSKLPEIYSYPSFIRFHLQLDALARYSLWYAEWEYTPDERPPAPYPWSNYAMLQWTDKDTNIPGIAGVVDADVFLVGGNTSMIPQGWSDDGTTLTAPNGHKVVLGFRGYVLTHQWDPGNWPLQDEEGANPVEDYFNQTPPDGSRQIFNLCELGYTTARGVYVVGIGNELLGCRGDRDQAKSDLAAAQTQIATLQSQLNANATNTDVKAFFAAFKRLEADAGES